jgi:hypothetical protein
VLDFEQCSRSELGKALANSLVVHVDPLAEESACVYRRVAKPWLDDVISDVENLEIGRLRSACHALIEDPGSVENYARLIQCVETTAASAGVTTLLQRAWLFEQNTRISYELGALYRRDVPACTLDELLALPPIEASRSGDSADILVVLPFRCAGADLLRLRNLVACLRALHDQSFDRSRYHVVVVETDGSPRWQDVIRPLADVYLFAPNAGKFNKSWAVNAGVMHCRRRPKLICILDADILCDKDFIRRNLERFGQFGRGAHLPYRDMAFLDPASTSATIRLRCSSRAPDADFTQTRRFSLRRPPGGCIWVRADVFQRVRGMDERYQGWGGEDDDFKYRVDLEAPLDFYGDRMCHMYHRSAAQLVNGRVTNADSIAPLSWSPKDQIGQLTKFSCSASVSAP